MRTVHSLFRRGWTRHLAQLTESADWAPPNAVSISCKASRFHARLAVVSANDQFPCRATLIHQQHAGNQFLPNYSPLSSVTLLSAAYSWRRTPKSQFPPGRPVADLPPTSSRLVYVYVFLSNYEHVHLHIIMWTLESHVELQSKLDIRT